MVLLGNGTVPGTRYGALNQDYVLTDVLQSAAHLNIPQCYIALVLDGHGMLGEECAKEAGHAIMKALKSSPLRTHPLSTLSSDDVEKILVDAFHEGHEASMQPYSTAPRTYSYPKQAPEERRYTLIQHRSGHTVYSHPIVGPRLLEFGTTASAVVVQGRTAVCTCAFCSSTSCVFARAMQCIFLLFFFLLPTTVFFTRQLHTQVIV